MADDHRLLIKVIRRKTCMALPDPVVLVLAGEGDLLHPALEDEADRCVDLLSLVVVALQVPVEVIHLIEAAVQVLWSGPPHQILWVRSQNIPG